jgi:CheY-like chemotaxis protein
MAVSGKESEWKGGRIPIDSSFGSSIRILSRRSVAVSPNVPSWQVLIADACAGRRASLRASLCALGHHPIESETGPTALRILHDQDLDLALVHVHLPGMDGLQVLQEFRKHRNDIAILVMSSESSVMELRSAFRNGGDSYLPLPVTKFSLADELRQAYERREVIVANLFNRFLIQIADSAFELRKPMVKSAGSPDTDFFTANCEHRP